MTNVLRGFFRGRARTRGRVRGALREGYVNLTKGKEGETYAIKEIHTKDPAVVDFLTSLGCVPGEEVTVISHLADNVIVHIKNVRYSIDSALAKTIEI